ncbi:PRC-barrel domain containing protein [Natronosporangium hydrolyticum]|uniref:PRC-barrel domain containing protein n=1 Tax=Natronosporangium hydrolyticum TaxID=2811111 RepID=A0A895YBJ6_9ACTN|nr:PRC-barrel domain containing protein [Natronosporangium hydrolyticum]QSB13602.1 PRC-barrel domain containing protein [Natronosporangium hydrolyticum]
MTALNPQDLPEPVPDRPFDPWNLRADAAVEMQSAQLAGYQVEAINGGVGKVVDASLTRDGSYLLVSTGKLIGKKTLVPAGTINHIDDTERVIYLDRSREQVKGAPTVAAEAATDPAQQQTVADYYQATYHTGAA